MDDALLFQLSPDEIITLEFLIAFALATQPLEITEQLVISAFMGLLGQVFVVVAAQRALIAARQEKLEIAQKEQEIETQFKELKKEIEEIKRIIAKSSL